MTTCSLISIKHHTTSKNFTVSSFMTSRLLRFLGGDGTESLALYRVSGHLYTVSFDSNLGDVMVRLRHKGSLSCLAVIDA